MRETAQNFDIYFIHPLNFTNMKKKENKTVKTVVKEVAPIYSKSAPKLNLRSKGELLPYKRPY